MIDEILKSAKKIAIVGLSPNESKDSYMVARYLQEGGFEIFPIYPKESEILGRKVYRNLNEIDEEIDMVVMFRKSEFADELLEQVRRKGYKTLWLQLGIINENARQRAGLYGINFVQDKCIKTQLQRIMK